MKVVSVNVGKPREIGTYRGKQVYSGIFKDPVKGEVEVRETNVDGDGQASLSVHGGRDKAAYAYPSEHYEFWGRRFPEMKLDWGAFGENLTTEGLTEDNTHVGDHLLAGSAEFVVTAPRLPCYKLGIKFGTQEMVSWFLDSGFTGFYLSVAKEGRIKAGDAIELVRPAKGQPTIEKLVQEFRDRPKVS